MASTFHNAHALVIGVGGDLPATVNDAEAIASILRDPNRCAIPAGNVRVLTERSATRSSIVRGLRELAAKTKSDDAVTIYFSGHGAMQAEASERRFLVPHDGKWLDGERFTDLLRNIPARRLLVLLDCCYAGGVHTAPGTKASGVKPASVPFHLDKLRLREGAGTVVLSSSRDDEVSLMGMVYSIFTQVAIDALCGAGARRHDGYVRVTDLAMYVAQWVPSLTNDSQHPQLDLAAADNYPVAYYAAGSKALPPRPDWFAEALTGAAPEQPATTPAMPAEGRSVRSALRRLRDILAESIPDEDEARLVAHDSGAAPGVGWGSKNSESFWQKVLHNADRARRMKELFTAADNLLGENPDWRKAKQEYLEALEAGRRGPLRSVEDQPALQVDLTLNQRRLHDLEEAFAQVVPDIFGDPRISATTLAVAKEALLSAGLIVEAMSAAARAETRQPMRHNLQNLDRALQKRYKALSWQLSVLQSVRSESAATQPCADLATATTDLLAVLEQASGHVT